MASEFSGEVTRRLADFISEIGLDIVSVELSTKTFLPGILVENGKILADETKLTYPGDLLHDAGHLALAPGKLRSTLNGEVALPGVHMQSFEVGVIAWSYAAILHLGLDPRVVFHAGGYGVESERVMQNFTLGAYIGVNVLQDVGLAAMGNRAIELGVDPYPHMIKWLRD